MICENCSHKCDLGTDRTGLCHARRAKDGDIVWNFTKFLVDKDGNAVKRYDPTCIPGDIEDDIVRLLNL